MGLGVSVRVRSLAGDDLGIAHVPPPVERGDLVCLEYEELRVVEVERRAGLLVVRAQPVHLPIAAR